MIGHGETPQSTRAFTGAYMSPSKSPTPARDCPVVTGISVLKPLRPNPDPAHSTMFCERGRDLFSRDGRKWMFISITGGEIQRSQKREMEKGKKKEGVQ
jgi:hypothetical protein